MKSVENCISHNANLKNESQGTKTNFTVDKGQFEFESVRQVPPRPIICRRSDCSLVCS